MADQDRPFVYKHEDGTVKLYQKATTPEELDKVMAEFEADKKKHAGKTLPGMFEEVDPAKHRSFDPTKISDWGTAAGEVLSLGSGLTKLPLAARMLLTGIGGGLQGASAPAANNEARAINAGKGVLMEGGLEGIFGGLSEALPRGGVRAGLAFGGARGDTDRAVEAFMRERARSGPFGSVPVAATSRNVPKPPTGGGAVAATRRAVDAVRQRGNVQRRIDRQGVKLEQAETGSTATTPISSLMGSTREAVKGHAFTPKGLTAGIKFDQNEREILQELAATSAAKKFGVPIEQMTEAQKRGLLDAARRAGPKTYGKYGLSMRDLGEFRRGTGRQAEPVIQARMRKEPVDTDPRYDQPRAAEAFHSEAKRLQDQLNPEVVPINERLSDLFTIREANEAVRGGGGIMSDLGQLSTRGGLAHGVTQSIGRVTQAPPGAIRNTLNALGLALLAPSVVSRAGYTAGSAAGLVPTTARLFGTNPFSDEDNAMTYELMKEVLGLEERPKPPSIMGGVRMRKP